MALDTEFTQMSAEDQAAMDAMRDADTGVVDTSADAGGEVVTQPPPLTEAQPQTNEESGAPAQPQQQMVPHAALNEERERRKAAEQARDQDRALFEARLTQLLQRFAPPQQQQPQGPQAPEIPALDKDPIGHFQGRLEQQNRLLNALVQGAQAQYQQSNTATVAQAVQMTAQAQENEFRATTPDYNDAAAFLKQSRHQELADLGYINPAEREAIISNEALQIAGRAIQQGRNAPEMIYALAQRRGFKPTNAAPAAASDANAASAEPAAPNAGDRLRTAAAGQAQGRSISGARGTAAPQMTAQRLIDMSESEYATWLDKTPLNVQMELMGN